MLNLFSNIGTNKIYEKQINRRTKYYEKQINRRTKYY